MRNHGSHKCTNKIIDSISVLRVLKIYTKTGDDGATSLQDGKRVKKDNFRIRAYGMVDEINATIGMITADNIDEDIYEILIKIQNELFVLGSDLSNPDLSMKKNRINESMIHNLEEKIDHYEKELEPLKNFILPGGSITSSKLHFSRAIIRRAESEVVSLKANETINTACLLYLNRLSDLFFVLARVSNKRKGIADAVWNG